jgi:hypothetical protein
VKRPEKKAPTRSEIEAHKLKELQRFMMMGKEDDKIEPQIKIDLDKEFVNENYAKMENKTLGGYDIIDISGVNEALEILTVNEFDKHPEKRMAAVN